MTTITIPDAILFQIQLREQAVEGCDATGRVVGYFAPVAADKIPAWLRYEITYEQLVTCSTSSAHESRFPPRLIPLRARSISGFDGGRRTSPMVWPLESTTASS